MKSLSLLLAASLAAVSAIGTALGDDGARRAPVPETSPASKPPPKPEEAPPVSDTWIFSGLLQGSKESYSGTLVAGKEQSQFEMKLGGGATCDGGQLKGEVGLVRLPEIKCSDERSMRALFVPQGGKALKVFGHVGEERFYAEAHLLGTEAPPEPKQTAQPKGPLGLPPPPPGGPVLPPKADPIR